MAAMFYKGLGQNEHFFYRGRDILEIDQPETRMAYGGHVL